MKTITIDARMLMNAGVGTYIRNIVPRLMEYFPNYRFALIGKTEHFQKVGWIGTERLVFIDCQSSIYSINEQFDVLKKIPRNTDIFWSPHYNIPVFYSGKLVCTVHDVFHLAMPHFVPGIHKKLYAKFMFSNVRRKSNAIICVSEFAKSDLVKHTGPDDGKIHTVYNGVDSRWFKSDVTNHSSNFLPHNKPYFLFVGSVKPHKNLKSLILAYMKIKDQVKQDLLIIGKTDGMITSDYEVMDLAKLAGDRIHFVGEIDNGEETLKKYYSHAHALVLPSFYESFGLPPLEAMACGCPVMVSNVAALPEIYGDAAMYFDPNNVDDIANALLIMNDNHSLRQDYIEKGDIRSRLYNWDKSAAETADVIRKVLMG